MRAGHAEEVVGAVYIKTEGLVLRETRYKEADKILTVLTAEGGRRTVKARGCRRKGSRIAASAQLLVFSEMTLFLHRERYTMNAAETRNQFRNLRGDMEKLALASYFAEVAETIAEEGRPDEALFSLVLNCLHALDQWDKPAEQVKAVFELRIASVAGYRPELEVCAVCGEEPREPQLHLSEGGIHCAACRAARPPGRTLPTDPAVLTAMRYMIDSPPKKILSFQIDPDALSRLSALTAAYLSAQIDREFATLRFYEQLKL